MKIAEGIVMLDITMNLTGADSVIHPTLIWDEDNAILIDAGGPGSIEKIRKAMKEVDVQFDRLNMIIVTHQDIDHIGGIKEIQKQLPEVEVSAHGDDVPYIQGEKRLVRLNSRFMDRINGLPVEKREKVMDIFENIHVNVDRILADGEELDCCGGIRVIHTPGHTPGHICLYHKGSKTLIVGDAMNINDGELLGPKKEIMTDEEGEMAVNSLKKLEDYDVENIICYHGGLFNLNPHKRIVEILSEENIEQI